MAAVKYSAVFILRLIVLLLVLKMEATTSKCCRQRNGRSCCSRPKLYLLSLLPYPDDRPSLQPSWDEGPPLLIAEDLAVDLINNRTDILRDYCLELIRGDSGCDIGTKAVIAFAEHMLRTEPQVAGIVGPGCSISTTTFSPLSGMKEIALINVHVAGSPRLTDRKKYPYSFGILDSTEVFVAVSVELMKNNSWTSVGAFYDESRIYYYSTLQKFEDKIQNLSNYMVALSSAVYETYFPFEELRGEKVRVVFLFLGPDLLRKVMCLAYHKRFVFPVYQWIIIARTIEDLTATSFKYSGENYTCSRAEMNSAVNGSIFIHYRLSPLDYNVTTDTGLTYREFNRTYNERIEEYNSQEELMIEPSIWGSSLFDAVWSIALAFNNSIQILGRMGLNLSDYKSGQQAATDVIRSELLNLKFEGLSGTIRFMPDSGYVQRVVDIYQVNYSADEITLISEVHFINGDFDAEILAVPLPLAVFFFIVTVLGLIMTLISHIFTVIFRKHKPVKASSPKLTHLAFIGCYTIIISITSFIVLESCSVPPDKHCILKHIVDTAFSIGFTLVLGSVCVKTWRLYRIFVHYLNPGRLISDSFLFVCVLILVVIDIIICSVWIAVDPFTSQTVTNFRNLQLDVPVLLVSTVCLQKYYFVWFGILNGFNGVLMIGALWLALLTRNIHNRDFQTQTVLFLVYTTSALMGLGYPLYFVLETQGKVVADFLVLCVLLNAVVYLNIVFLFIPPIFPTLKKKYHAYLATSH